MEKELYPLPQHTDRLPYQIAGHKHGEGRSKLGLLKHEDGYVLKPLIEFDQRAERELKFYEMVFDKQCVDNDILTLRNFLSEYSGVWVGNILEKSVKYLRLKDVTDCLKKPSVLDVKIGSRTFDPEATAEKILAEKSKYPDVRNIGFRILGMKVFLPQKNDYLQIGKEFGKKQNEDTIVDAFHLFLNKSSGFMAQILISGFLHRLNKIHTWFKKQRRFTFYSSSLLFTYEGESGVWNDLEGLYNSIKDSEKSSSHCNVIGEESCIVCSLEKHTNLSSLCNVYMIDFAHVFPSNQEDENFIFGLSNLIKYLLILYRMQQ